MEQILPKSSPYFYPFSLVCTGIVIILSLFYTYQKFVRSRNGEQNRSNGSVDDRYEATDQQQEDSIKTDRCSGDTNETERKGVEEEVDPMTYCEHIQSEVKKAKQRATAKKLNNDLTPEQIEEERNVQRQQLESIFELMKNQEDKFGVNSMDEVYKQMKLYA